MSRNLLFGLRSSWLAASLLAMPSAALADVMEISGAGHVWIAGGPVTSDPEIENGRPAASNVAFTEVGASAGPSQWRARVSELSTKYDVSPALLEAVIWQESRWRANAISPAGARGLAQLMPGTARQLGVDTDDPQANLEGGVRYLRMQLDAFDGDIEKALAAYNAGPGRVRKAKGIPAIRETQGYVAAILSRLSSQSRR